MICKCNNFNYIWYNENDLKQKQILTLEQSNQFLENINLIVQDELMEFIKVSLGFSQTKLRKYFFQNNLKLAFISSTFPNDPNLSFKLRKIFLSFQKFFLSKNLVFYNNLVSYKNLYYQKKKKNIYCQNIQRCLTTEINLQLENSIVKDLFMSRTKLAQDNWAIDSNRSRTRLPQTMGKRRQYVVYHLSAKTEIKSPSLIQENVFSPFEKIFFLYKIQKIYFSNQKNNIQHYIIAEINFQWNNPFFDFPQQYLQ
ncbi:unnamed protein product [Paramecium sonneborni]|uniref:Uncharacterized protein n=1 Tax=Paramecium sonneborni TaxID=65129 RepID=A0A8S1RQ26_9CILI|nr:unnamed protein product [Paramecium sonneborni]